MVNSSDSLLVLEAISVLVATSVGVGMFALPAVSSMYGLAATIFLLLLAAFCSGSTTLLLAYTIRYAWLATLRTESSRSLHTTSANANRDAMAPLISSPAWTYGGLAGAIIRVENGRSYRQLPTTHEIVAGEGEEEVSAEAEHHQTATGGGTDHREDATKAVEVACLSVDLVLLLYVFLGIVNANVSFLVEISRSVVINMQLLMREAARQPAIAVAGGQEQKQKKGDAETKQDDQGFLILVAAFAVSYTALNIAAKHRRMTWALVSWVPILSALLVIGVLVAQVFRFWWASEAPSICGLDLQAGVSSYKFGRAGFLDAAGVVMFAFNHHHNVIPVFLARPRLLGIASPSETLLVDRNVKHLVPAREDMRVEIGRKQPIGEDSRDGYSDEEANRPREAASSPSSSSRRTREVAANSPRCACTPLSAQEQEQEEGALPQSAYYVSYGSAFGACFVYMAAVIPVHLLYEHVVGDNFLRTMSGSGGVGFITETALILGTLVRLVIGFSPLLSSLLVLGGKLKRVVFFYGCALLARMGRGSWGRSSSPSGERAEGFSRFSGRKAHMQVRQDAAENPPASSTSHYGPALLEAGGGTSQPLSEQFFLRSAAAVGLFVIALTLSKFWGQEARALQWAGGVFAPFLSLVFPGWLFLRVAHNSTATSLPLRTSTPLRIMAISAVCLGLLLFAARLCCSGGKKWL